MILKIFRCRVPASTRDRFLAAQRQWRCLASVRGFLAQRCGFVEDDPTACAILALWRDRPSHERFMTGEHDRIVESGGQVGTYLDGRVDLVESCTDGDRAMRNAVDRLMASDGVTLIEFDRPPGDVASVAAVRSVSTDPGVDADDGVLTWRWPGSTTSVMLTDFERHGPRSDRVSGKFETRRTHVRWVSGLDPQSGILRKE